MRRVSLEELAASFRPGERVFLPGSAGECAAFTAALAADPSHTRGLQIVTSFLPGVNPLPITRMAADVRVSGLFMQSGLAEAQREGRFRHLVSTYFQFASEVAGGASFDATVVHVAPPDAGGWCSLGAAAEFTALAAARSARVVAVVNPRMPRIVNAPRLAFAGFTAFCEVDEPLRIYDPGAPDLPALQIAGHAAAFVPDGATLQLGIGKAPAALASGLKDRRGLRLWSGLVTESFLALAEAGALEADAEHVCCAAMGACAGFYAALAERADLRIAGCDLTHDPRRLADASRFTAVNGALEVDLFGQANLEQAAGHMVSGAGGAPDFAHAAARGEGASIVALPSTAGAAARSRIVPRLQGGLATLPRHDVDIVVTEHGAADLRGLHVDARAQALIAIAAPAAREALARAWRDELTRL